MESEEDDESEWESESEEDDESEGESESEEEDDESEGESESEEENESEEEFGVGDRVRCHWYQDGTDNQWYDCVVLHVDDESRTAHVRCDDGDSQENMSWD